MAKFKVGDKVSDGNGVYLITGIDNRFGSYEWKLISGRADPSYSKGGDFGWTDAKMKIANSRACNAGKAMISRRGNDWYYAWADGAKDGREGPFKTEEEAIIAAKQDGFKIVNSQVCNSTNPVVRKAMNACATNAAYPKASDKTIGNVTAFFLPRYDEMGLEFGSVPKGNYMSIEGSRAEVRSKVRGKVKGQDLSDALKLCDWADSEMEKYRKSEQSHGRKVGNACANRRIARNGVGDSFSDAVAWCTDAMKALKSGKESVAKSNLMHAKRDAKYVSSYKWADSEDKAAMRRGIQLLDAAISNPTEAAVAEARKVLEAARAKADGNDPRSSFNTVRNGRDILMELGMIEGDIEDGDMAEARSWLREIKNEAMRKGYYKEWNQLARRAGM